MTDLREEIAYVIDGYSNHNAAEIADAVLAVLRDLERRLAGAQAVIERLGAELDRKDGLFNMLLIAAGESDNAFYGTLATHFVRDIAQQGIDAPKAQEPYGCEAPKPGEEIPKTRSQQMREAGFTRRPPLPSDE